MNRKLICIKCPKGCVLSIVIEDKKIISVTGNDCSKAIEYAHAEIENPMRILTTTVKASGLDLKMVPVRTEKPISLNQLKKVLLELQKITLTYPVEDGKVIISDILGLGVDVMATRQATLKNNFEKG